MGAVALVVWILWLSKGWKLIQQGMTVPAPGQATPLTAADATMTSGGQYISLSVGATTLTAALSILAWNASSDWAYAPGKPTDTKFWWGPAVFIMLIAWWPYRSWKNILGREPNSDPKYLRRHRRTAVITGMLFTVMMAAAVTYGIQNGHDRVMAERIEAANQHVAAAGKKVGAIKQRDLQTTDDYIKAYAEIGTLLPDFASALSELSDAYLQARQADEGRGPINIQRFYRSHYSGLWSDREEMVNLLRQDDALTQRQVIAAQKMGTLPRSEQVRFWQEEFRPLLLQEGDLREKLRVVAKRLGSHTK